MTAMTPQQASEFASRWLPAWTGNEPQRLAAFYTDDLFYSDPTVSRGLVGNRNEVYFDTLELITAIRDWNKRKSFRDG